MFIKRRLGTFWVRARYTLGRRFFGDSSKIKGSKEELHRYWSSPPSKGNQPQAYAKPADRSDYLLDVLKRAGVSDGSVLEVGCNVGRNLNALQASGYGPLTAIEINSNALEEMKKTFPNPYNSARLFNSTIEDTIPTLRDKEFDVTFSMAVLLHIHPDSEWILEHMVRVTRSILVVIESEDQSNYKIFPRDYSSIFKSLGVTELFSEPSPGTLTGYTTRVFQVNKVQ